MSNASDFIIENGVLKKYVGPGGDVTVPEGVTAIKDNVFEGNLNLTGIVLSDSVTKIGTGAFYGCANLKNVELPGKLRTIGQAAFTDCKALQHAMIPKSVKTIGAHAFSRCGLVRLEILAEKVKIGPWAFDCYQAPNLIHISDALAAQLGVKEIKFIFDMAFPSLIEHILNGTADYSKALYDTLVAWVKQKKNRTEIAESAIRRDDAERLMRLFDLRGKVSLEEVDALIEAAGKQQKQACTAALVNYKNEQFSQKTVDGAKEAEIDKALGIKERSVADWRKIFKLAIKDGRAEIIGYLDDSEVVEIPEKIGKNMVAGIRWNVFRENQKITGMIVPKTVTDIAVGAFKGCTGLQDERGFVIINGCIYDYFEKEKIVDIPDGITKIDGEAFCDHEEIEKVNIPDSVREIGCGAFGGCHGLADQDGFVIIRNTLHDYSGTSKSIVVPDGVEEISGDAFIDILGGEKTVLTLPGTVKHITASRIVSNITYFGKLEIHAPAGSYAESYAKEHNIPFVAE